MSIKYKLVVQCAVCIHCGCRVDTAFIVPNTVYSTEFKSSLCKPHYAQIGYTTKQCDCCGCSIVEITEAKSITV